jgi:branched-subunit amino acid aminotransferase/4-amino-4-deoxychorismate lyase
MPDRQVSVTTAPLGAPPTSSAVRTVTGRAGLWRHKWAERGRFAADEAAGTPLYVAGDGTVLETSRGNVFLVLPSGGLVTAPLRDDLLPGITRRAVLDLARDRGVAVQLRPFGLDELLRRPAFWTSSLSGAVPILSVDGAELPRADDEINSLAEALFVS